MRRIAGIALLAVALVLAGAGGATAGERATLTWDTDDTDVDLHVWDEFGNHAWYADQDGIPLAYLSTDIRYGFGPEHFEEFEGAEGYEYTYGVCYYASNRDDGAVPDTVATVTLTDPDGSQRTLRRVLRSEGEAYHLGSSPVTAPLHQPPVDDWCRGSESGPYHPVGDGGPDPTGAGGCNRVRRRIGVVDLCADEVAGAGSSYVARGNVRANGGVVLGDGPFELDTDAKTVTGNGVVQVVRGGSVVPIVAGALTIDARAATEPVSGRTGTAAVSVAAANVQLGALKIAGLPLTPSPVSEGFFTLHLDPADGGGVIAQSSVALPFASGLQSGSLAVGVHPASGATARVLGGSATFGELTLPGGWGLTGFSLTYEEGTDSWKANGGLTTPAFGVDVNGGLADGRLDALGVGISREVRIGPLVLKTLGGSVTGLARPPLRISATASGSLFSVPRLDVGLILLQDVTLTVNLAGSASLRGRVALLYDDSPVKGRLSLEMRLSPFRASGSIGTSVMVGPFAVDQDGSIAITSSAFTAMGRAHGKLFGSSLADGRSVVSDTGLGVTGTVCVHPAVFGRCLGHATLGVGTRWSRFPSVEVIGGDVQRFVTVSRTKATQAIRVARGRPFLIVEATGPAGTVPSFTLVAPGGKRIGSRRRSLDTRVVHDRANGYTAVMVLSPRSGRWKVRPADRRRGRERTRFRAQTVRRIKRVRVVGVRPAGSRRHPVRRRRGAVRVSWTSAGLPRNARVAVYVTRRPGRLGRRVARGRRARGSVRIPGRRLERGVNRVRLIVTVGGVPMDDVLASQVIRAR